MILLFVAADWRGRPMSALDHQRPRRSNPRHGVCPLCSESGHGDLSSPSPIVLITVLYFSAFAIFQALVERFAFLDYANSLYDVGYLFGLNNNCLALCLASPSNASQFVFGKPFANMTLSETCFPLFTVSMRCPCCQKQRSDTG